MRQKRPPGCCERVSDQFRRLCSVNHVCCHHPKFRMKIRVQRCGGWRRCCGHRYRGTPSKMFRHAISQLAKFPTFKTSTFPIALNAEAIGVAFQRGQNCSRCQQKAHCTKSGFFFFFFFFSRVCSHPGAVCQSHSEYTLHRLEHLEVRSSLIII